MNSPTSLQLTPTEDLVNELFSRFDTAIFNATKEASVRSEGVATSRFYRDYRGQYLVAVGLVEDLKLVILDDKRKDEENIESEDL